MTNTQKIIKICAQAFAIFLIITIISAIASTIYIVGTALMPSKNTELKETICDNYQGNIDYLEMSIGASNIEVKKTNTFKIETNNVKLKCKANNNSIIIDEKNVLNFTKKGKVIVYLPEMDKVDIEVGAGLLEIEDIKTNKLKLNLGAGKTIINNLNVTTATIDAGAGSFEIKKGIIDDLDFDMGVGSVYIKSKLNKADIDSGIGTLNIDLIGNETDHLLDISKGIGQIKVMNQIIERDEIIGNGNKKIKIDGGIGNIKINFIQ